MIMELRTRERAEELYLGAEFGYYKDYVLKDRLVEDNKEKESHLVVAILCKHEEGAADMFDNEDVGGLTDDGDELEMDRDNDKDDGTKWEDMDRKEDESIGLEWGCSMGIGIGIENYGRELGFIGLWVSIS